jgi:hypothetical protein
MYNCDFLEVLGYGKKSMKIQSINPAALVLQSVLSVTVPLSPTAKEINSKLRMRNPMSFRT